MARHAIRHTRREFDNHALAERRLSAFQTQAEVAEGVGVSSRQYLRWEQGQSQPQVRHVRALAEHFGVEPASFYGNGQEAV
jgi:transcriptional regulator with XRE-family HTH domain